MEYSETIWIWTDETLKLVQEHPDHEMGALRRRDFYRQFRDTEEGQRFLTELDIFTARHVLSIYEDGCPVEIQKYDILPEKLEDFLAQNYPANKIEYCREFFSHPYQKLARRMIENAKAVMNGTMENDFLKEMVNNHYHTAFGPFDWLSEDNDTYTARAVTCALYAAYAAAKTAVGYYPLDHLEHISRTGFAAISGEGITSFTPNFTPATALSDNELGGAFGSDAAAGAMVAVATVNQQGDPNPDDSTLKLNLEEKLLFWDWWLTGAIPTAYMNIKD